MKGLLDDIAPLLQEVDEGLEELALVAVLVEIGGVAVAGGEQDHPFRQEVLEQSAQNRSVRHVRYLEFVQVQQPRLCCPPRGYFQERVVALLAAFQVEQFGVYSRHELVEMLPLFFSDGELVEEKVGKEAFA